MSVSVQYNIYNQLDSYNPERDRYTLRCRVYVMRTSNKLIQYIFVLLFGKTSYHLLCTVLMEIRHVIELQKNKYSCNIYGKLNRNDSYTYTHLSNITFEVKKKKTTISIRHCIVLRRT